MIRHAKLAVLLALSFASCQSAVVDAKSEPWIGMCFDFEELQEGRLPTGFLLEASRSSAEDEPQDAARVAPARGHRGGRGIQIRSSRYAGSTLWLTGSRFEAARYSLRFRSLEERDRIGLAFATEGLRARDPELPEERSVVAVDVADRSLLVLRVGGDGAREIHRVPELAFASTAWQRLAIAHDDDRFVVRLNGQQVFECAAPTAQDDRRRALAVGIYVHGACVLDDFWIE